MFEKTTTEKILSVFTKTIAKLEAHVAAQEKAHADARDVIARLIAEDQERLTDVAKAEKAIKKLKDLF